MAAPSAMAASIVKSSSFLSAMQSLAQRGCRVATRRNAAFVSFFNVALVLPLA